jgi:hypothetical protein
MTPEEFIREAKARGMSEDETRAKFSSLKAAGKFSDPVDPLDLAEQQLDAMDGPQVQPTPEPPKKERGVMETFKGAIDAVATIGSEGLASAVGGTLGFIEGAVESGLDGTYGTQEGIQQIQETMQQRGDILRRGPSTDAGQEILQGVGEVLDPLARADQLGPLAAAIPTQPIGIIPRAAGVTARAAGQAVSEAGEAVIKRLPGRGKDGPDTGVGAAEADGVQEMMVTARELGFEGDSAPTVGQATRDPQQLMFENEVVKTDIGGPLQVRRQNQQEQLGRVFDEMEEDNSGGLAFADDDDQGRAVQAALEARKAQRKSERDALYAEAKAAGELDEMIDIPRLPTAFKALEEMEGLVQADPVVMKVAQKHGLIDASGNPRKVTVQKVENFREFVNKAYDYASPRDRRQRGIVMSALDAALDGSPSGKMYKAARAEASDYRNEFFNSPLASRMTKNKRNANVPSVDPGKVFQTIRNGSIEEIDQLRNTMNATPEGQAQWNGIKGRMIASMREKAFGTQQDGARNALATPSTFIKEVQKLSRSGKLRAILGNKDADKMEDLAQLVSDLMTSPPGSANHSNTVAAIKQWARMAPDMARGLPVIENVVNSISNANTRRKVSKALSSDSLLGSAL